MKVIIIVLLILVVVGIYFSVLGVISRSGQAPGLENNRLVSCRSKPNCVSSAAPDRADHYIAGISLTASGLTDLRQVISQMGGKVTVERDDYLAAEFKSGLFGFVDDLELLIDQGQQMVQVRSGSRVGYSDMGVNRKRVEKLRQLLESLDG